ncbi:MAG TPA: hypothetical protein DDY34_04480 [Bacteroidales bacterium]|nr:hypothetical protein [Bacteroidales bacterium]HBH83048.1 hypothetical protein [Bacteroidales bacterium]HBQ84610.1 hypothetical protein [Bacteroidales bacterium]HCU19602.1 hypothetical protein [Bacteroidales bacterium]
MSIISLFLNSGYITCSTPVEFVCTHFRFFACERFSLSILPYNTSISSIYSFNVSSASRNRISAKGSSSASIFFTPDEGGMIVIRVFIFLFIRSGEKTF